MAGHPLEYDVAPTVNPSGAPSGDFEHIEAGPEHFGGLIGQSEQKLGAGVTQTGEAGLGVLTQYQGMLNETMSTNAETSYMTDLGKLTGAYRSKEGLDAVAAQPQYQKDVADLRQQYLKTLPTFGAQRAFNLLALRHEGYALQDSATYSADQLKKADLYSANSSSAVAIASAGSLDVAQNDERFQDQLHAIDFATRRAMQNQGWGSVMHEDQDHNLTFDDSPQGQQAKTVYDQTNGKAIAMAYENRFKVLADQNVVNAYNLYQKNRDKIPGQAQVELDQFFTPKIRDAQVRTVATGVLSNVGSAYQRSQGYQPLIQAAGAKYGVDPGILTRQGMQESGFRDLTSKTGAQGISQFEPGTAARYDVNVHDAGSSIDGQAHYMSDLLKQFNGNYGLALAGYNWGEGNVAKWIASGANPAAMPAETRNYIQSITGQPVETWITGQGKLSAAPPVDTTSRMSQADYYRVNYQSILDETRQQAEAIHPDDPRFVDMSVARVEQQINGVIKQQELSYKADSDLVQKAFNGGFLQNGQRPASIDQMIGGNPEVKAAWERMQINNPLAAQQIETRILTANSREGNHDVKTYGPGFYDLFRQVHAPEGDPNRITNPQQLWSHIGPKGDLTVSGLEKLTSEIEAKRSPEGAAEAEMKKQFLANARAQITGTDEGLHIKDPKGDELYLKFLAQVLPAYDAGRKEGKSPTQLLNPDSPDYIGKTISGFKRPMSQWYSDVVHDQTGAATSTEFNPASVKSLSDLVTAFRNGQVDKATADQIAIAKGWGFRKPAQTTPEVPISQ